PESSAGAIVQQKLAEYNQKRQIRAEYFLHSAYHKALRKDFAGAIKFLEKIPEDTDVYPQAQIKIQEYKEKQQIREKLQEVVGSKKVSFMNQISRWNQIESDIKTTSLYLPDYPQEVNI
ncbi:MAG: serine/threonine protein kinase, partial [Sphaerospermopsis kisseleviana]